MNDKEALRVLREADYDTAEGLEQVREALEWVSTRDNVPQALRAAVAAAESTLQRRGWMERTERIYESTKDLAADLAGAVGRLFSGASPGNPEAAAFAPENLSGDPMELASSTESTRRPFTPDPLGGATEAGNAATSARLTAQATAPQVEGGENFAANLSPDDIIGGPSAFDPTAPGGAGLVGPGGQAGTQFLPSRTQAYYEGSETDILRRMPTEQRARVQEMLVAVGLTSKVIPGEMDPNTVSGFSELLAISNRNGEEWRVTVDRLQRAVDRGEIGDGTGRGSLADTPGYVPPPALQPDPARLRVSVRNMAQDTLGRELDEDEVDYLTAALEDVEQQNYSRMVAADRANFDASIAAQTTGADQTAAALPEYGDAVVASRFRELFEQKYANEIDMRGRVEVGRTVSELVGRGAGTVAQMTGGR